MRASSRLVTCAAALAIAGGAVTGCGSDNGSDTASTPPATTQATTDTGAATATTGTTDMNATVGMEGVSFTPDAVSVTAGGTVTFDNTSTISHNVTFDDQKSGTLAVGDTYKRTFKKAGSYSFVCTFHAGMKGTVTVK